VILVDTFEHAVPVWHKNRDFTQIAGYTNLATLETL
jgi:hypothetical protein